MTKPLSSPKVEQLFASWHLARGGIGEEDLARLLGKMHAAAIRSAHESIEALLLGPFELKEPVRCGNCGGLLTSIPCSGCGTKIRPSYKLVEPRHESR